MDEFIFFSCGGPFSTVAKSETDLAIEIDTASTSSDKHTHTLTHTHTRARARIQSALDNAVESY